MGKDGVGRAPSLDDEETIKRNSLRTMHHKPFKYYLGRTIDWESF